jgi:glycosyltransferase involved in cell wall biosynthesis
MQPYVRLAVRFAGWLRKPIWLDAYISFYETQVHDRKLHQPGSAEAQALLVAERAIISGCERLIFLNRAESDYYLGIWDIKIPPEKISYVPLAAPFRPQARLPNLGQNSRLTFAWWGRLGNPLHGLDVLLEAFALLPGRNFRLVVAADGSPRDLEDLRSRVLALGLSEVVELRSDLNFNNGTLLSFLVTETDVALGVFGATAKARTVNVNKVVDALSLGLPCLTRNSAALQTMPDVDKFLHLWAGDCIKELAASIQFGLDHSELWRDKSKMASAAFLKYFSPVAFDRACDDLLGTFSRD